MRKPGVGFLLGSLAVFGCWLASWSPVVAEVSVPRVEPGARGVFIADRQAAGGEDPGAWPVWRPLRDHLRAELHLNRDGEFNGDGPPAFALDPDTGFAIVVWAWFDGGDFEVVLSSWDGKVWRPFEWLTDNQVDDLDPRVEVGADGRRMVTWWRANRSVDRLDEVWYREHQPALDIWSEPEQVSPPVEQGRHPDVAHHIDGSVHVVFQAGDAPPWSVTVAWRPDGAVGFADRLVVAHSDYGGEIGSDPLAADVGAEIHESHGRLWVEWLQDDNLMGYSVYQGAGQWSAPEYLEYRVLVERAGSFSAGVDLARQQVRWRVLR